MTTAIALETSRGDLDLALGLGLGIVLLSLIVAINATAQFLRKWVQSLTASFLLVLAASAAFAQEPFITVASTTSTEESGLFGYLLPVFTKETGIQVRVVAVGTGQALKIGERGDCDVVFVHDRLAELAFVERGFGIDRREVMYNDFILVGPNSDPAHVDGGKDIVAAFRKIVEAERLSLPAATTVAPPRRRCASGRRPESIRKQPAETVPRHRLRDGPYPQYGCCDGRLHAV